MSKTLGMFPKTGLDVAHPSEASQVPMVNEAAAEDGQLKEKGKRAQ
jgi:hypothetical protein